MFYLYSYIGSFPEQELHLAESSPPYPRISGLELGLPLVQEMFEVSGDRQQDGLWWDLQFSFRNTVEYAGPCLVIILPVPLVNQVHIAPHGHQSLS